ncbi:hypothetical protein BJX99DRAFT_257548 [Aspergillus californicus]
MATGIEATGLILALLPLLVNQLDNYVQGLETLKGFTAKRYRMELDTYAGNLGAQQSIFLNTLEQALTGVIDDEDEIREWMRCPDADNWKQTAVHDMLQERLGRSFEPFVKTTIALSRLLEDIANKLNLKDISTNSHLHRPTPSGLGKEVKKFRHILSKSVYADIFSRIDTANTILRTLVEQSHHQTRRKTKGLPKRLLRPQKRARTSASSLYNSIMSRGCWDCACRHQHSVRFVLNTSLLDTPSVSDDSDPRFRMIFASRSATSLPHTGSLHEVEAESECIPDTTASAGLQDSQPSHTVASTIKAKLRFQIVTSVPEPSRMKPDQTPDGKVRSVSIISDICFTLSTFHVTPQPKLLGCVADGKYRHSMYYLRPVAESPQTKSQSLEEIIAACSILPQIPTQGRYIFSRRDRLLLAVRLACSVLTFHGSWLQKYWRSQDILFASDETSDRFNSPYIMCDIKSGDESHIRCKDRAHSPSPLIRNEILFPLGLTLVELSLCQTLESLRTSEDIDPLETVSNLKTAARCLPVVDMESGHKYAEVVNHCLFGSCAVNITLDNEAFQDEVFQTVISPLVENLRSFDGKR